MKYMAHISLIIWKIKLLMTLGDLISQNCTTEQFNLLSQFASDYKDNKRLVLTNIDNTNITDTFFRFDITML